MLYPMINLKGAVSKAFKAPSLISANLLVFSITFAFSQPPASVLAEEYTVSTKTTVKNGAVANVLNGTDKLTITSTGEIKTSDANSRAGGVAVETTNAGNTVVNNGKIINTGSGTASTVAFGTGNNNKLENNGMIEGGSEVVTLDGRLGNQVINTGTIQGKTKIIQMLNTGGGAEPADAQVNKIRNSGTIKAKDDDSVSGITVGSVKGELINEQTGEISGHDKVAHFTAAKSKLTNAGLIKGNSGVITFDEGMAELTNSGLIKGKTNVVLFEGAEAELTNTGTIESTSKSVSSKGDDFVMINSGMIISESTAAVSLEGDNFDVTNMGTIKSTGGNSFVVATGSTGGTLTNSGSIITNGRSTAGAVVFAGTGNTLNNKGSIISERGKAIDFQASGNTLKIDLSSSFILGDINLSPSGTGETGTTVTLEGKGVSSAVLWTYSNKMAGDAPNMKSSMPTFHNASSKKIATYDPTMLNASGDLLASVSRDVSDAAGHGKDISRKGDVWVKAFGSRNKLSASNMRQATNLNQYGVAVGADGKILDDTASFGMLVGYGFGSFEAKNHNMHSYDNAFGHWFAGIHGRSALVKNSFIDMGLSGGLLFHDDKRFFNDNMNRQSKGKSSIMSSYDSRWISPEVVVGAQFDIAQTWKIEPSVGIRYAAQLITGTEEVGSGSSSAAKAKLADRLVSMIEGHLELAVVRDFKFGYIKGHAGVLQRNFDFSDKMVDLTLVGQKRSTSISLDKRRLAYAGLDVNFDLSDTVSFNAKGSYGYGWEDSTSNMKGSIGFKAMF